MSNLYPTKIESLDDFISTFGDEQCDGCQFYIDCSQTHPYGDTTATESLWECSAPNDMACEPYREYIGGREYIEWLVDEYQCRKF